MNLKFVKKFPDGPFLRDGSHISNNTRTIGQGGAVCMMFWRRGGGGSRLQKTYRYEPGITRKEMYQNQQQA